MMDYNTIINDDCLHAMQGLEDNTIDSIVTDPPYGLSFMGKDWDHGIPGVVFWQEALRIAKPGCHLLAFGGTRTFHRLAVAIEDAGWEIRDTVMWVYGSGFPKSLDVSKAIDKMVGAERAVVGLDFASDGEYGRQHAGEIPITAPATPEAVRWQGYGTALKPAWEPVIVARKPIDGTVANNVLKWGTGGINIDGCRVIVGEGREQQQQQGRDGALGPVPICGPRNGGKVYPVTLGRFPANLIHDGSDEVVSGFPNVKAGVAIRHRSGGKNCHSDINKPPMADMGYGDSGSASRFFYCAKASKSERGEGNNHPTVKPLALMRYLCRLVTPPDGVVLDPFCGSGSTLVGALQEGFRYLGIEKDPDYVNIAYHRTKGALKEMGKEAKQLALQEVAS